MVSTEFQTVLPPQVISYLQLSPFFWKTWSTRERSGKILAPAGEQKERHLGGMRGHRASEWGQVMQGGQLMTSSCNGDLLPGQWCVWGVGRRWILWWHLAMPCLEVEKLEENEILQVFFWGFKFPFSPGDTTMLFWGLHCLTSSYEYCAWHKGFDDRSTALAVLTAGLRNSRLCFLPYGLPFSSLPTDEALFNTSAFLQVDRKGRGSVQRLCNSFLVYPDGFSVAEVIWMMNACSF